MNGIEVIEGIRNSYQYDTNSSVPIGGRVYYEPLDEVDDVEIGWDQSITLVHYDVIEGPPEAVKVQTFIGDENRATDVKDAPLKGAYVEQEFIFGALTDNRASVTASGFTDNRGFVELAVEIPEHEPSEYYNILTTITYQGQEKGNISTVYQMEMS